jgi:hypothetical protein
LADRLYYWSRSNGALLTDDRFNAAADGSDHLVVDDDPAVDATVALSIVARSATLS